MKITLEKCSLPGFDRGERIIMVDGVRWGRTRVTYHGVHGTKHVFEQEGGEMILENPGDRYPSPVAIRSERRRFSNKATWRPVLDRVADKAAELVASGKLRDPAIVLAEQKDARDRMKARAAETENKEKAAFEAKAREVLLALAVIGLTNEPKPEDIAAVIAAMRWAQEQ